MFFCAHGRGIEPSTARKREPRPCPLGRRRGTLGGLIPRGTIVPLRLMPLGPIPWWLIPGGLIPRRLIPRELIPWGLIPWGIIRWANHFLG